MSDIDEIALETARKIYRINTGRVVGGRRQYIAMIQVAVREAIEQARDQGVEMEGIERALSSLERYKKAYDELYTALGMFLDDHDGETPISIDAVQDAWDSFNSAPGPVFWSHIESALRSAKAARAQGAEVEPLDLDKYEIFDQALCQEVFEKLNAEFDKDPNGGITILTEDWRASVQHLASQPAQTQGGEVEPVGYVSGEALENLKKGHPVHAYAPDTPLVFGSKVWIYTHPPAPTQGVPEGWKLVPVALTGEMIKAFEHAPCAENYFDAATWAWEAMVAAAPEAPNHPSAEQSASTGDGWVRCDKVEPEFDEWGKAWFCKWLDCLDCYEIELLQYDDVYSVNRIQDYYLDAHWMPTGLKPPEPPKDKTQEASDE